MQNFVKLSVLFLSISGFLVLQACGGGGGGTPSNSDDTPVGVSLNAVGNKLIAPGTALNFTVSASNPDDNSISFSTNSTHAIYMNQGASFNPDTRQFSWTPSVEGSHQITFNVTNNDVTPVVTDSETITINVSSRVQLNAIGNKTVGPGGTLNFTVSAFNPDSNSVSLSTNSSHDIYTNQGAMFNTSTGQFSWAPSVEGTHQITFTVTNNDVSPAVTDSETITINVSSRVQLNTIGNKTVGPGGTLNFTISASNPDSNSISFSTNTSHDIYTSQGAMFNTSTAQFSWAPSVEGTHQITFTVTNNDVSPVATDSETITIDVASRVQLNPIGSQSVTLGGTLSFSVSATNPDSNSITLGTDTAHIIYTNQNAAFSAGTGQFSWTPAVIGNHSVSFSVTNNDVSPPVIQSETVSINVTDSSAIIAQGKILYDIHCLSCHGPGGENGSSAGIVIGSPPEQVRGALGLEEANLLVGAMSGIVNSLANPVADANSIGYYLCDVAGVDINDTFNCAP